MLMNENRSYEMSRPLMLTLTSYKPAVSATHGVFSCVLALPLFANTVSVTTICDRTWQFAMCSASFICPRKEIYNLFTLSYWETEVCVSVWACVCVCVN